MPQKSVKHILSNMTWRFMEGASQEVIRMVVSIILARLLEPDVYGIVALVMVVVSLLRVFTDSGLGVALIQRKGADNLDFSSVFYFNLVACSILYLGVFFTAPWVSAFYKMPELTPVLRVLSLQLILYGVTNVQQAYISKNLLFKYFFYATLAGTLASAAVGIWMAYAGYGVWALVGQTLAAAAINVVTLWFTVKWRPDWAFSWQRLKGLMSFGWKMLASTLTDTLYRDIRSLLIGRLYTPGDLAFYQRGIQFPAVITQNINASIDSVLLPAMSDVQDDITRVKNMTRRSIMMSTFIIMPMMAGLAACAAPVVRLLLTEKWTPCIVFMRIFCFTFSFYPVHTANLNAIKALGRSDLFLQLEIWKKVVGLSLLAATIWISVKAMAYSLLLSTFLGQLINSWPNKKLLGYSYLEQVKDMLPQILLSCLMGAAVFSITFLKLNDLLTLCIQIPFGAVFYMVAVKLTKIESGQYVENTIRSVLAKRKVA